MKKIPKTKALYLSYFLIVTGLLFSYPVTLAGFENNSKSGVRAAGLGRTFTAVDDDASALFWNPAGIGRLEFMKMSYAYALSYPLQDEKKKLNYLSLVYPISKKIGNMGVGWSNSYSSNSPNENTFILSYGRQFNDLFSLLKGNLYMGINLKTLCSSEDDTTKDIVDELFDRNNTESIFNFDFAALYSPMDNFSLGLAGRNLLESSIRETKVHREIALGGKYNLGDFVLLDSLVMENITSVVDFTYRDKNLKTNLGVETWFLNSVIGIRTGINVDEATCGFTFGGISTKHFDLKIDYSFVYPLNTENADKSHYIGFSIGGKAKEKILEKVEKEKELAPYLLGPKDEIDIFVRRHPELSGKVTINPEGKISFPILGDVDANVLSKTELAEKIKGLLTQYIENPDVVVNIVSYRSKEIYVLGEVRHPGKYSMEGNIWTVKDAIAQGGFPTGLAATWRVYVITPKTNKPLYKIVNLYKILYQGKLAQNIELKPGDIIYVPTTVLGKISSSLSYLLDPFFKTRSLAEPIDEGTLIPKKTAE